MFTIVGGGPAGCLMALLLARRGESVTVFERQPDPAHVPAEAGRSINLALAARGLRALQEAGLAATLNDLLVPMRGRRLHEIGLPEQLSLYGQRPEEIIYSISRAALTARLQQAVQASDNIELHFETRCLDYLGDGRLSFATQASPDPFTHQAQRIIGADGGGSTLRRSLARLQNFEVIEERLEHDYKELLIPSRAGQPPLAMDALHIWPRGGFMLIALPNHDGSFTATLFLSRQGNPSFDQLQDDASVLAFFQREFPDVLPLIPDLAHQFSSHRQGFLGTVRAPQWRDGERLLLIGDAAHAIVPFHGQGMNCAFEDCRILNHLLQAHADQAFEQFENSRRTDCAAIAQMALENYLEMRRSVRDPHFQLQKSLALSLERTYPGQFIPRYAMVMFHDEIPYSVALARGQVQQQILDELTRADTPEETPRRAAELINQRLPPL